MCEIGKHIKLCTCLPNGDINAVVHHKKSQNRKNRDKHTWTLSRYLGNSEYQMDGMITMPDDMLVGNLNSDFLLQELNSRNCFDFEYSPNEGDNLQVYNPVKYASKFLSFILRDGFWVKDYYNGFKDKTEKINYGTLLIE